MDFEAFSQDKFNWNRRLLNLYWSMVIIQVPIELLFFFTSHASVSFIWNYLLLPTLVMVAVMLVLELVCKLFKPFTDHFIIVGGHLIIFAFLYFNYGVKAVSILIFLPVLISIFYFQPSRILLSVFFGLLSLFTLFFLKLEPNAGYKPTDLIAMIPIFGIASFVSLNIMNRGVQLLHNLKATTEMKQELMIQNIIMDKLSKMDALTDLYNHITFHEYLEKLIEQSESGHLAIHLAVLDIDNFKKVNDTFGHRAGDTVLKKVSGILKERVGLNDFVARYGGEEFAVIFTEKTLDEAFETLEAIRWHISQITYEELNGNAVTISIGLSEYRPGLGKEALFSGADQCLYTAKKTGKNKTVIFQSTAN
ncbi:GGDEF domain-containing protein [Paenibacillus athensensis]|uniref:GGDEF domain-containing protein n=1 Tax=Paenibacillus athensensis TaxID=1967502 RepID=A0A4Y8Q453_9BACL|nr:GGDEF domain-containing protein [Paenibacillus athensensis]MCD1260958.1 GGDEF domain-containing protein [Paenibacillus athensensis]